MATETVKIDSNTNSIWNNAANAASYLDDASDSTFIDSDKNSDGAQTFDLDQLTFSGTITEVRAYIRYKGEGDTADIDISINGSLGAQALGTPTNFTDETYTWSSLSIVNSSYTPELTLDSTGFNSAGESIDVAEFYLEVDYTPSSTPPRCPVPPIFDTSNLGISSFAEIPPEMFRWMKQRKLIRRSSHVRVAPVMKHDTILVL